MARKAWSTLGDHGSLHFVGSTAQTEPKREQKAVSPGMGPFTLASDRLHSQHPMKAPDVRRARSEYISVTTVPHPSWSALRSFVARGGREPVPAHAHRPAIGAPSSRVTQRCVERSRRGRLRPGARSITHRTTFTRRHGPGYAPDISRRGPTSTPGAFMSTTRHIEPALTSSRLESGPATYRGRCAGTRSPDLPPVYRPSSIHPGSPGSHGGEI